MIEDNNFSIFEQNNMSQKYKRTLQATPLTIDKEDINYQDETTANEFICSICNSIPLDPAKCSKCNVIFCKDELNNWLRNNKHCPMRCSPPSGSSIVVTYLSPTENNILSRIGINCRCGAKELTFSNIQAHFKTCKIRAEYSCLQCNAIKNTIDDIEKHVEQDCPVLFCNCEDCGFPVRKSDKESHQKICKETCQDCHCLIPKLKITEHKLNKCSENVKRYYENLLNEERNKVELKLKPFADESETLLKEKKIYNDYFGQFKNNFATYQKKIREMSMLIDNSINFYEKEYSDIVKQFGRIKRLHLDLSDQKFLKVIMCLGFLYGLILIYVLYNLIVKLNQ
jgi:hypothetical protein